MKIDYSKLTSMQLDALREVGNIGAGHAATALSQIIGHSVLISISCVSIVPIAEISQKIIGGGKKEVVCIHMKLLGDVLGGILLILSRENALSLVNVLKNEPIDKAVDLSEMDISSLKESGSILSASYLTAIGDMMEMSLLPSAPELSLGEAKNILDKIFNDLAKRMEVAFCIETEFIESNDKIKGYFLLIPEVKSLDLILQALGLMG